MSRHESDDQTTPFHTKPSTRHQTLHQKSNEENHLRNTTGMSRASEEEHRTGSALSLSLQRPNPASRLRPPLVDRGLVCLVQGSGARRRGEDAEKADDFEPEQKHRAQVTDRQRNSAARGPHRKRNPTPTSDELPDAGWWGQKTSGTSCQ